MSKSTSSKAVLLAHLTHIMTCVSAVRLGNTVLISLHAFWMGRMVGVAWHLLIVMGKMTTVK